MRVNGKQIQKEIKESIKEDIAAQRAEYRLAVVYVGENPVISRFVEMKKRFGEDLGVSVEVFRYDERAPQSDIIKRIKELGRDRRYQGIIVQLPLPARIDTGKVLNSVPAEKDIDVLSEYAVRLYEKGDLAFVPTVAGAVAEIFKHYNISVKGKNIVMVGRGRLVGIPIELWLSKEGVGVTVIDSSTRSSIEIMRKADIIITGVGSPHMIKPHMIKKGVVLIDAGTSEQGGKLLGDVDPSSAEESSLFTPVPGGIGPITTAILFRNLVQTQSA